MLSDVVDVTGGEKLKDVEDEALVYMLGEALAE